MWGRVRLHYDVVQKSELYKAFMDDTGLHKTQKAFYDDIAKCNVSEKKNKEGTRLYCGILRKNKTNE